MKATTVTILSAAMAVTADAADGSGKPRLFSFYFLGSIRLFLMMILLVMP
jgi:hypothetical protein